jgi:asparagine synthase (glutamine-hydrolysing)
MIDAIAHRGPDEEGYASGEHFAFAAKRLAITDVQNGRQPFTDAAAGIFLIQNGEIFNHRSLRAELSSIGYSFNSHCDAEVALKLYIHEEVSMIEKLEGQFALAVWDEGRKRLFIGRDRFGICPLFYHYDGVTLSFASEIKALRFSMKAKLEVNKKALAQVMTFGACISPLTFFKDVHSLPPGHTLVLDKNGLSIKPYWDLVFPAKGETGALSPGYYQRRLKEHIERAVGEALPKEVPFGTFLSSGIDSTIITAVAQKLSKHRLPCYTVASPNNYFNERSGAMRTSSHFGLPLHIVDAGDELISGYFPATIRAAESPVSSTESAALLALAKKASGQVKVILTGEGADEAFAGYASFRISAMADAFSNSIGPRMRAGLFPMLKSMFRYNYFIPGGQWDKKIRDVLGTSPAQSIEWEFYRDIIPTIFTTEWTEYLLNEPVEEALAGFRKNIESRESLDQSLYLGYKIMLSNYLLGPHGDRVLMAHGIEGRYPFLDRQLAEFAADVHPAFKKPTFTTKFLLRSVATEWVPPGLVPAFKRRFMTSFSSPFSSEAAPPLVKELLAEKCISEYGYFDPHKIEQLMRAARRINKDPYALPAEQLHIGVALSFAVSTQLVHYLFIKENELNN